MSNFYLVVFFDVVQTTIIRHESGDLFTIFDQLHSDALSNGRIWLFGFDTAEKMISLVNSRTCSPRPGDFLYMTSLAPPKH